MMWPSRFKNSLKLTNWCDMIARSIFFSDNKDSIKFIFFVQQVNNIDIYRIDVIIKLFWEDNLKDYNMSPLYKGKKFKSNCGID